MSVGDKEIFGPVLCIKRVKDFEEGIALMNANEFANGSVHLHAERLLRPRVRAGGRTAAWWASTSASPCRSGIFGFTGHKNSFFGDLHAMGTDGIRFFTELKSVTSHWFSEEEACDAKVQNSWDGMISYPDAPLAKRVE